jgi:hypothetical protein
MSIEVGGHKRNPRKTASCGDSSSLLALHRVTVYIVYISLRQLDANADLLVIMICSNRENAQAKKSVQCWYLARSCLGYRLHAEEIDRRGRENAVFVF